MVLLTHKHTNLLAIIAQEVCQLVNSFFEGLDTRQINDAEVIGFTPVKTSALNNEHFFVLEQIESKLLVIGNIKALTVKLGENIEGCPGLHHADTRNIFERIVYVLALLVDTAAWLDIVAHRLMTPQRRLNNRLCGHIRAQTHV